MDVFLCTPVMKRIPMAYWYRATVTLTKVIRAVTDAPGDSEAWKGLLQFAGVCLRRPK